MQRNQGTISCEICGRKVDSPNYYRVSGGRMVLCKACAARGNYKKIKTQQKKKTYGQKTSTSSGSQKKTKRHSKKKKTRKEKQRKQLIRNYGQKIKAARLEANITKKELARKLREKVSYISKIEKEKMKPPKTLIAKLEGYLGINLTETVPTDTTKSNWGDEGELTVGDVVQIKGREKKDNK